MAAPELPVENPTPKKQQPKTFNEIADSLTCPPCGGAFIRPSGLLPSGTLNIGDAIADITSHLTAFTGSYNIVLAILKMIGCIIEVICAIANPFEVIPAVIRLFTECLPAFILIFPLFIIPSIILCFIKIILAIADYILTSIVPVIQDIIQNVKDIKSALNDANSDAIAAVAFKIAGLIQELFNIIGILAVLGAISEMIKVLIALGLGIPCGDSPSCPSIIQSSEVSGTDGVLTVLFAADGFTFTLRFGSPSKTFDFRTLRGFFPVGLNYAETPVDEIPYKLTVCDTANCDPAIDGNSFAVTSIDSGGNLNLIQVPSERLDDGYLSTQVAGFPSPTTLVDPFIRFGTDTPTFNASMVNILNPRTVDMQETRNGVVNTGAWNIVEFYDAYNVKLEKTGTTTSWSGLNTVVDPEPFLLWRLNPLAPSAGSPKTFTLDINHEELYRHGIIGTGCHPAVKAARQSAINRFPDLSEGESLSSFGDFPDLNNLIDELNSRIGAIAPPTVDTDFVLDNYDAIGAASAALDLATPLNSFIDDLTDYARKIAPLTVDVEATPLVANPSIQLIGEEIVVHLTPLNRSGTPLAFDLPPGVISVEINTNNASLTTPVELLDAYGVSTGVFESILTSDTPIIANITGKVFTKDVADFNGAILIQRVVPVEFILPAVPVIRGEVSTEPLGVG